MRCNWHASQRENVEMELDEVLRRHGGRLTRPRVLVWEALGEAGQHVTVQELAELVAARDASVNVSSVYRALELFDELGLVRESRTDALGSSTWERRHSDGDIHLVCVRCGSVRHHHTELVERLCHEIERTGFDPATVDVQVAGWCGCGDAGPGRSD